MTSTRFFQIRFLALAQKMFNIKSTNQELDYQLIRIQIMSGITEK